MSVTAATTYRWTIWCVKALSEYTKNGYLRASKRFNKAHLNEDITDLSYMITGANSGIGKCTALALAKKGATVHMVCRNPSRGEEAKQSIITESGNDKVQLHVLDMSKPRDIIKFASSFDQPLDVLVNSARCNLNQLEITEDSIETNFAVNTLGTYLLTTRLMNVLEKRSSPRVVTVSSGGILLVKLDPHILNQVTDTRLSYTYLAQHKRQQVVMSRKWAEQYPSIQFSSMHPGWVNTPGSQNTVPDARRKLLLNQLRTPEQGADTVIWLCVAKNLATFQNGSFYQDRRAISEHLREEWTQSTEEEENLLMSNLETLAKKFTA